ncbi:hypothetical protein GMLC_28770 [Geomonas limicola]|uniref:Uncharacterized protein n=1 Tax=Geomonas limicola TaxID=2740186 RepID=A0A6V8N9R2_9BACT|nr:hypothetical protein GMLC_28770 [Geomonas limicola]
MRLQWIIIGYAILVTGRFFWRALRVSLQEWLLRTEPTPNSWEEDLLLAHGMHGPHSAKTTPPAPLKR